MIRAASRGGWVLRKKNLRLGHKSDKKGKHRYINCIFMIFRADRPAGGAKLEP